MQRPDVWANRLALAVWWGGCSSYLPFCKCARAAIVAAGNPRLSHSKSSLSFETCVSSCTNSSLVTVFCFSSWSFAHSSFSLVFSSIRRASFSTNLDKTLWKLNLNCGKLHRITLQGLTLAAQWRRAQLWRSQQPGCSQLKETPGIISIVGVVECGPQLGSFWWWDDVDWITNGSLASFYFSFLLLELRRTKGKRNWRLKKHKLMRTLAWFWWQRIIDGHDWKRYMTEWS